MTDLQRLAVITAGYGTKEDAINDYDTVKELYNITGIVDTFDAAIIHRKENGKVEIVKKYEQATREAGLVGAGIGMAVALTTALFPAVALTGGLVLTTTGIGAAYGAVVGHITTGLARDDLKELGQALDEGEYGLIVIAQTDVGQRVEDALAYANKIVTKELKADKKQLDKEIKAALAA